MTFPKLDDDQRAAAFNRGNYFRRIGEFDKALAVYERIVQKDETDAEAHWYYALCRYGIPYIFPPALQEKGHHIVAFSIRLTERSPQKRGERSVLQR